MSTVTPCGKYRHLFSVRQVTETQSATGAPSKTYVTKFASVHGLVNELSGLELIRGQRVDADVSMLVKTRWQPTITPKDEILYNGQVLEIVAAINPDSVNRELYLYCKKAVL